MDLNITKNVNTNKSLQKQNKKLVFTQTTEKEAQQTCDLVLLTVTL